MIKIHASKPFIITSIYFVLKYEGNTMTKQVCYFALKSICCAHHLTLIYGIKIIIIIIIAKHIQIFYLFIYIRLLILSDILIAQAKILLKLLCKWLSSSLPPTRLQSETVIMFYVIDVFLERTIFGSRHVYVIDVLVERTVFGSPIYK